MPPNRQWPVLCTRLRVPNRTSCINCSRPELVRFEVVIKGPETSLSFYCGHCEITWQRQTADIVKTSVKRVAVKDSARTPTDQKIIGGSIETRTGRLSLADPSDTPLSEAKSACASHYCPNCGGISVGAQRHIIGGSVITDCHCRTCNFSWQLRDTSVATISIRLVVAI